MPASTKTVVKFNDTFYLKNKNGQYLVYEVCPSKEFDTKVIEGKVKASEFGRETDYTVQVDLDGDLESNQTYFYRFFYNGVGSQIGRCKTLPTDPSDNNKLEKLRLAVLTCNDYSTGYFNAFCIE